MCRLFLRRRLYRSWWLRMGRIGRAHPIYRFRLFPHRLFPHRLLPHRLLPHRTVRPAPSLWRHGGDGWPGRGLDRHKRPPGGAICCLGQKFRHRCGDGGVEEGSRRPAGLERRSVWSDRVRMRSAGPSARRDEGEYRAIFDRGTTQMTASAGPGVRREIKPVAVLEAPWVSA